MLKRLDAPLLTTRSDEREGYVPNVVYSCGGVVHDGRLWLPYGIGDARISVAWADVDELIGCDVLRRLSRDGPYDRRRVSRYSVPAGSMVSHG